MQLTVRNNQELETVINDIRRILEDKPVNISYGVSSKEKTVKQVGFLFGAIISQLTSFFQECGFNVDSEDVRYKLYKDVSEIVPEMVVDKSVFGGIDRIKHLSEMDRVLLSKFIDGIFAVVDNNPLYAGVMFTPDVRYNWAYHIEPEEIKFAQTQELKERDADYLNYIRGLPCIICGKQHRSEAHHIRDTRTAGTALKSPDWYTIPLCSEHHHNIAHGTGFKEALRWIPLDLIDFCRCCYIRWLAKR